jgi:hypothetical protein
MLGSIENARLAVVNISRDRALPPVYSTPMIVMRMYATQTAILRLAERIPARSNDRDDFALRQKTANDRLGDLLYCLYLGVREAEGRTLAAPTYDATPIGQPCIFVETLMLEYGREIIKTAMVFGSLNSEEAVVTALNSGLSGGVAGVLVGLARGGPGGIAGGLAGLQLSQVLDIVFKLFDELTTFGETLDAYYTAVLRLESMMASRRHGRLVAVAGPNQVPLVTRDALAAAYAAGEPSPRIVDFAQISVMNLMACAFLTSAGEVRDRCGRPPEPIFGPCFASQDASTETEVRMRRQCIVTGPLANPLAR